MDPITILASYASHTMECMFTMMKARFERVGNVKEGPGWTVNEECTCGFRDVLAFMGINEREALGIMIGGEK